MLVKDHIFNEVPSFREAEEIPEAKVFNDDELAGISVKLFSL